MYVFRRLVLRHARQVVLADSWLFQVIAVAQSTSIFLAIVRYGFGEVEFDAPSHANSDSWKQSLFAADLLYIICMGVSKIATAYFLGHLSREKRQNLIGHTLAGLAAAWTIASVLAVALRQPLSAPYLTVGPNVRTCQWLASKVPFN